MRSAIHLQAGQFAKFRGSWGRIAMVNQTFLLLDDWRGRFSTTAPIEEIVEIKPDERKAEDPTLRVFRRYDDFRR